MNVLKNYFRGLGRISLVILKIVGLLLACFLPLFPMFVLFYLPFSIGKMSKEEIEHELDSIDGFFVAFLVSGGLIHTYFIYDFYMSIYLSFVA